MRSFFPLHVVTRNKVESVGAGVRMGPFTKSRVLRGGTTCAIVVYQPYLVKEKWAFPAAWRVKEIAQATVRGAPPLLTLVLQPAQPSCDRRFKLFHLDTISFERQT